MAFKRVMAIKRNELQILVLNEGAGVKLNLMVEPTSLAFINSVAKYALV